MVQFFKSYKNKVFTAITDNFYIDIEIWDSVETRIITNTDTYRVSLRLLRLLNEYDECTEQEFKDAYKHATERIVEVMCLKIYLKFKFIFHPLRCNKL